MYTMPDGNEYPFPSDEEATRAMNAWESQFGSSAKQKGVTPEFQRKSAVTAWRGEHPVLAGVADVATGMSGLMRSGANLIRPGLGEKLWPSDIARDTGWETAGEILDPVAMAAFGGGGGIARQIINPKVGGYATGIAGGLLGGGVVGGISDKSDATSGALTGAGAMAVLPPVLKYGSKAVGAGIDLVSGRTAKVNAGKIMKDVAGEELPAIKAALKSAPSDVTAAQATSEIDRDVWQALGKYASSSHTESYYRLLGDKQEIDNLNKLAKLARGDSAESSAVARKLMQSRIENHLGKVREAELSKAGIAGEANVEQNAIISENIGGRAINPITGEAYTTPQVQQDVGELNKLINLTRSSSPKVRETARRLLESRGVLYSDDIPINIVNEPVYTGLKGAMQQAGKLYAEFGNQVNQSWKTANRKLGWAGDVKIARHVERGLENYDASKAFVDIAAEKSLKIADAQDVLSGIERAGLTPLDVTPIINKIDAKLASKVTRTNPDEVLVLNTLKERLAIASEGGITDPFALYNIRKLSVNQVIDQLSSGSNPRLSKTIASKVLNDLKPMIDEAIESAGGEKWGSGYVRKYHKAFQAIERVEMLDVMRQMYKENPDTFVKIVRGEAPEQVQKVMEGKMGFDDAFSNNTKNILRDIASQIEQKEKMKIMADSGHGGLSIILDKDTLRSKLPTWINRWTTAANKGVDLLEGKINKATRAEISKGMRSGKDALDIINTLPTSEKNMLLNSLIKNDDIYGMMMGSALTSTQRDRQ